MSQSAHVDHVQHGVEDQDRNTRTSGPQKASPRSVRLAQASRRGATMVAAAVSFIGEKTARREGPPAAQGVGAARAATSRPA